ncbi:50S ribosomal protein L28 [Mahella sp.]|uniref:50S ribosomal protein L28 n=1 Tax=Mahella sp. TaxID=2798721 RepID=UPI0025C34717|nr:50S ribosomal protein L28 [Mahella sp.]MBZ4666712.1 ribosomal protein [Mahella sp.]
MSKECAICHKSVAYGNAISHSHRRSNRRWEPNLRRVRIVVNGAPKRAYVCTRCLRSGKVERAI